MEPEAECRLSAQRAAIRTLLRNQVENVIGNGHLEPDMHKLFSIDALAPCIREVLRGS
jgi:hypothetical protein